MEYKISIIIPVYKVEKYIAQCCHSLFNIENDAVEFIFVDDASPDASIGILCSVLEQYPQKKNVTRILYHDINKGVAAARNTGLLAATGEYIAFVDADDWVEKDMFEKMYETARRNNSDIVGCDWYLEFERNRRILRQPVCLTAREGLYAMLAGELRWYLWSFIIRRSLFIDNEITFLEGADIGEDMAVLIKCFSCAGAYTHIAEALYHHIRYNDAALTYMQQNAQICIVRRNVNQTVDFLNEKFPGEFKEELDYFKLNVKFPLLITDDIKSYDLWNCTFSESDYAIWNNPRQPLRNKLLQSMAKHHCYLFLILYYKIIFKFVYGVLFR